MATVTTDDEKPQPRDFALVLLDLARGETNAELTSSLHDLIGTCQLIGKKGTLTLTIEVVPVKGSRDQVTLNDKVVVKPPTADRAPSNFYLDRHGRPTRDDPRQLALLEEVRTPPMQNVVRLSPTTVADTTTGLVTETPEQED